MVSHYAPQGHLGSEPRFRRDLTRKPSKARSRYISKLLVELGTVETLVREGWEKLDASERRAFRAMVVGAPSPRPTLMERFAIFIDSVEMVWAIWRHRAEAYQYFAASYRFGQLVQEKVGEDMWAEVSPTDIASIDRGLEDVFAGRTVALVED